MDDAGSDRLGAGRSPSGVALAEGDVGVTEVQPIAEATSTASSGPRGRRVTPTTVDADPDTRLFDGPDRRYSRWSMSRKPVFFARTPRLVTQVIAQSTMPTASSPPAILYWIMSASRRAHGPSR